jgi:glycosyltransferase involved in cell wall biosynthesis
MLTINGRFLTQRTSGVQRYAREMLLALDDLLTTRAPADDMTVQVLVPPDAPTSLPALRSIPVRRVGRLRGHLWEQLELPRHARGVLLNWCNTFPVLARHQVVVLHDASVIACPGGYTRAFRAYYRALFALAARSPGLRVATDSAFSAMELRLLAGIPASRLRIIACGADHWRGVIPDETILDRLDLRDTPFILTVASDNPNKNTARLVAAYGRLAPRGVRLVLAGASHARVFAQTASPAADGLVRTGYLADAELAALYRHARAFVFPSLYEGFGLPPLEAMTFGCPVLCSYAASLPEVAGDAALYCDAEDVDEIARRLQQILADDALRERLIAAGTRQVQRFLWRDAAAKMLALAQDAQPRPMSTAVAHLDG